MALIEDKNKYISLQEAAKGSPYSADYLRLLAGKGKLFAERIDGKWHTTQEAVNDYIAKQSLTLVIPKSVFNSINNAELENSGQFKLAKGSLETGNEIVELISARDHSKILQSISDNIENIQKIQG